MQCAFKVYGGLHTEGMKFEEVSRTLVIRWGHANTLLAIKEMFIKGRSRLNTCTSQFFGKSVNEAV